MRPGWASDGALVGWAFGRRVQQLAIPVRPPQADGPCVHVAFPLEAGNVQEFLAPTTSCGSAGPRRCVSTTG